jgi:hypothetical protein
MTTVLFTLGAMDSTTATGWWTCAECGIDAELPGPDTSGFHVPCPDCPGLMTEQWTWDPADRRRALPAAA